MSRALACETQGYVQAAPTLSEKTLASLASGVPTAALGVAGVAGRAFVAAIHFAFRNGAATRWMRTPVGHGNPPRGLRYKRTYRSRSALAMTETELKVIAALAMMGLRSRPKKG
jgi:hypothetical protein